MPARLWPVDEPGRCLSRAGIASTPDRCQRLRRPPLVALRVTPADRGGSVGSYGRAGSRPAPSEDEPEPPNGTPTAAGSGGRVNPSCRLAEAAARLLVGPQWHYSGHEHSSK